MDHYYDAVVEKGTVDPHSLWMLKKKKLAVPKRPESITASLALQKLLDLNFDATDVPNNAALEHASSQLKLPELPKSINQRNGESS